MSPSEYSVALPRLLRSARSWSRAVFLASSIRSSSRLYSILKVSAAIPGTTSALSFAAEDKSFRPIKMHKPNMTERVECSRDPLAPALVIAARHVLNVLSRQHIAKVQQLGFPTHRDAGRKVALLTLQVPAHGQPGSCDRSPVNPGLVEVEPTQSAWACF